MKCIEILYNVAIYKYTQYCTMVAILQGLLGIFYRIRSPALVEDLPYSESKWQEEGYKYSYWEGLYEQVSNNCFIAAGLYAVTLVISFVLWRINERSNYAMS